MLSPVKGPPSGPRFMQLSQSVEWKFSRGNEVADDVSVQTYKDIYAVVLDQLSQLDIGANEMEGLLVMCNRTEVLGVLTTYPSHLLPESMTTGSQSRSKWTLLSEWRELHAGMDSCSKLTKDFLVVASSQLAKRMPKKQPSGPM